MHRSFFQIAVFVVMVTAGSGCALTNVNMRLPDDPIGAMPSVGHGEPITVVVPFSDERNQPHRCGMQKNGYNMDTADATCDQPPADWLARRLVESLQAAGFEATSTSPVDASSSVRVEGTLLQLFVEPVIGMWTGSHEADIHVRLRVTSPNGLDAEREFFTKGVLGGQFVSVTPSYEHALRKATDEILTEMVGSIGGLLDRYPMAVSATK